MSGFGFVHLVCSADKKEYKKPKKEAFLSSIDSDCKWFKKKQWLKYPKEKRSITSVSVHAPDASEDELRLPTDEYDCLSTKVIHARIELLPVVSERLDDTKRSDLISHSLLFLVDLRRPHWCVEDSKTDVHCRCFGKVSVSAGQAHRHSTLSSSLRRDVD